MLKLNTILVPTDFSELSLESIPVAWELAREHQAEIVLVHACQHPSDLPVARKKLDELAHHLEPLPHRIEVAVASPVEFLYELAEDLERAMIVVPTHAWRGTDRQVLGSVTERLVSRVPCAILTVKSHRPFVRELEPSLPTLPDPTDVRGPELRMRPKSPDDFYFENQDRKLVAESRKAVARREARLHGQQSHAVQLRSLMVPVDFSKRSDQAVEVGVALAQHYGAELVLLHVLEDRAGGQGRPERESQRLEVARAQVEALRQRLVPASVSCETHVEHGPSADTIVNRAKRLDVDMVVMGSRGRRTLIGIPLGSTARVVVRRAPCAVLILKGPRATELIRHPQNP